MDNKWIWRYKNVYYYYYYYCYYYLACFCETVVGRRPIKCETMKFTRARAREKASVNQGIVLESTYLNRTMHL